jgi:hypothetical protein
VYGYDAHGRWTIIAEQHDFHVVAWWRWNLQKRREDQIDRYLREERSWMEREYRHGGEKLT